MSHDNSAAQLRDTQEAFDSVAADYDGPRGNNALIQQMRAHMWHWLDATFREPARLIDIGCGTGLDAVRMAGKGHSVTAIDWSAQMVQRTGHRAQAQNLGELVRPLHLGAQELHELDAPNRFDGAYSNLGPLNCVADLAGVARQCARLVRPGGTLVFSVIGRLCPWEIAYYARHGRGARIKVRFARGATPVGMNQRTIWTYYYTPREFYRFFAPHFQLLHYRALCVLAPPPYLLEFAERHPRIHRALWALERRCAGWPGLRSMGDHFLMILRKP